MPTSDNKPAVTLNLRQRILDAPRLQEERLFVDEWGCEVIIRELTGKERANFLTSINAPVSGPHGGPNSGKPALDKFYADLAILSVRDPETGERVFEPADREALNAGSGNALERIAQRARIISALDPKAFETAEKNSESAPRSSTPTN